MGNALTARLMLLSVIAGCPFAAGCTRGGSSLDSDASAVGAPEPHDSARPASAHQTPGNEHATSHTLPLQPYPSHAAASEWATSADGRLSLRIIVAHGPIGVDEPIWTLAELRNHGDGPLALRRPFGARVSEAAAKIEMEGPAGRATSIGPRQTEPLTANDFAHLGAGGILQSWLRLDEKNFSGLGGVGQYTLVCTYAADLRDAEEAQRLGYDALWTGEIRTAPAAVTKVQRPHRSDSPAGPRMFVRLSRDEYRFTLAEAAAGVRFDYDLVVTEDSAGVVAFPQDMGGASNIGPSGLKPFETISGNSQSYGLFDVGLAPPTAAAPQTIERGVYPHSFSWDGRNWRGPSDTSMPKGSPFPPGTYTLRVRIKGEMSTPIGAKPYDVSDTAKVVLTR